jgi:hypothetical protein
MNGVDLIGLYYIYGACVCGGWILTFTKLDDQQESTIWNQIKILLYNLSNKNMVIYIPFIIIYSIFHLFIGAPIVCAFFISTVSVASIFIACCAITHLLCHPPQISATDVVETLFVPQQSSQQTATQLQQPTQSQSENTSSIVETSNINCIV